ncbi:MAG: PqqD family protein [Gammaproteobacteria bacterium]|nr:PqqD family protein [Gammaproteobacteria bacterium]
MYIQNPNIDTQEVEGEFLVLDRKKDKIHQLNQTASAIWLMCDGNTSKQDMMRRYGEMFEISSEQAQNDVNDLIAQFIELGIIVEKC